MNKYKLSAQLRQVSKSQRGTSDVVKIKAKHLRRNGSIPANLIFKGNSTLLSLSKKHFESLLNTGLRSSSVIELDVEDHLTTGVVIKELQRSPITDQVLHVDLYQITKGDRLAIQIGIEPKGISKGVKAGGTLEQYIRYLKVRTIPEALQEVVEVDVSDLALGDVICLKDLSLPKEWEILLEGNPIVIRVVRSRVSTETVSTEESEEKTEASAPSSE